MPTKIYPHIYRNEVFTLSSALDPHLTTLVTSVTSDSRVRGLARIRRRYDYGLHKLLTGIVLSTLRGNVSGQDYLTAPWGFGATVKLRYLYGGLRWRSVYGVDPLSTTYV